MHKKIGECLSRIFFRGKRFQRGATLIEIIIATGVVGLVMTSTVAAMTVSLKATSVAKSKSLGTKYTQEGLEFFRAQRNLIGWESFVEQLQASNVYCLATLPDVTAEGISSLPSRPCLTNEYVDEQDRFKRQATVSHTTDGSEDIINIEVLVTWQDGTRNLESRATVELRSPLAANYEPAQYIPIPTPIPSPVITPVPTPIPTPIPSPVPTPSPSPAPCTTNIVQGQTTNQSSTLTSSGAIAARAADGNRNGVWANNSISHTNNDAYAWWEVDLGQSYDLTTIDVYNRTDNSQARLSNYYIYVSNYPFASTDPATTQAQPGVTTVFHSGTAATPSTDALNVQGRYIRIQLNTTQYLTIAEVEAFGCVSATQPPAPTAWQYRTPLAVTNGTGAVQTTYPVMARLNTAALIAAGKMASDCSDLRMTDANGTTLLPFWIQESQDGCDTSNTLIFVEVPSIPSAGTTLYAYYGRYNAIATNQDPDNTFDFFEDFNDATLNATRWGATGAYTISGGLLTVTTGTVYSKAAVTATTLDRMFEMRARWGATPEHYAGIMTANAITVGDSNSASNRLAFLMSNAATNLAQTAWGANGAAASYNVLQNIVQYTPVANTFYYSGFGYTSSTLRFFANRSQTGSYANAVQYAPFMYFGYFRGNASGTVNGTNMAVDFAIVRKFAVPEPTTTASPEESGGWAL